MEQPLAERRGIRAVPVARHVETIVMVVDALAATDADVRTVRYGKAPPASVFPPGRIAESAVLHVVNPASLERICRPLDPQVAGDGLPSLLELAVEVVDEGPCKCAEELGAPTRGHGRDVPVSGPALSELVPVRRRGGPGRDDTALYSSCRFDPMVCSEEEYVEVTAA